MITSSSTTPVPSGRSASRTPGRPRPRAPSSIRLPRRFLGRIPLDRRLAAQHGDLHHPRGQRLECGRPRPERCPGPLYPLRHPPGVDLLRLQHSGRGQPEPVPLPADPEPADDPDRQRRGRSTAITFPPPYTYTGPQNPNPGQRTETYVSNGYFSQTIDVVPNWLTLVGGFTFSKIETVGDTNIAIKGFPAPRRMPEQSPVAASYRRHRSPDQGNQRLLLRIEHVQPRRRRRLQQHPAAERPGCRRRSGRQGQLPRRQDLGLRPPSSRWS